jgi:large conductance mechanosensitive channel
MGLIKEFKEFAMRGNVVDLAVGVIIGAAFGGIVNSLVKDVIMPPIGLATGGVDFKDKVIVLKEGIKAVPPVLDEAGQIITQAVAAVPPVTLNYGLFINAVINFLIIAFCIFLVMKQVNRLMPTPAPPPAVTRECPQCCSTISNKASRCPNCTSELVPAG